MKKWKLLDKKILVDTPMFDMFQYHLLHGDKGTEHNFYIIETFDWVNIIPITPNNEVVLIHQYRAGNDSITLEIPGGVMDQEQDPIITARRELEEETGYTGNNFKLIGTAYPNPAFLKNKIHFVLAQNVEPNGHIHFDPSEYIETELVPLSRIPKLIRSGEMNHALAVTAFVYLELDGCCGFRLRE